MDYILYFILTISILVFVHELGHFLAARLCKMRTDVFAIGFGKRLFGWNKINGFTIGDLPADIDMQGHTDYRLSLLPLGGYVKIAGMVDESFDTSFADKKPEPYEFRAKPTYQKLFVISAGVLMNLFLTIAIFSGINYFQGKQIIKTTTVGIVRKDDVAYKAGFRTGDKILSVNENKISDWEAIYSALLLNNSNTDKKVTVFRNDSATVTFTIPTDILQQSSQQGFFLPIGDVKPLISSVVDDSPAHDSGIEPGDIFLSVNNTKVTSSSEVVKIISANPDKTLPLVILRGKDTVTTNVTPSIEGKIGIALRDNYVGPIEYKKYSLPAAVAAGVDDVIQYVVVTFEYMKRVFVGQLEVGQAFGGPIKIAQIAAESADMGVIPYLRFLAALSLSLAILNILPFPVLDGGHFVIILIEGILRREISLKVKIAIQNAGFIILLLLMAFIIYNDILNF
jgi:regulator of sigma E protease